MKKHLLLLFGVLFVHLLPVEAQAAENPSWMENPATRELIMWMGGIILVLMIIFGLINWIRNMRKPTLPSLHITKPFKHETLHKETSPTDHSYVRAPETNPQIQYNAWKEELTADNITTERVYEIYNAAPGESDIERTAKDLLNVHIQRMTDKVDATLDDLRDIESYAFDDLPASSKLKEKIATMELEELKSQLADASLTLDDAYRMWNDFYEDTEEETLVLTKITELLRAVMNDPTTTAEDLDEIRDNYQGKDEAEIYDELTAKIVELYRKEEEKLIAELSSESVTEQRLKEVINSYNDDTIEHQFALLSLNNFYLRELDMIEHKLFNPEVTLMEGERSKLTRRLSSINSDSTEDSSAEVRSQELMDRGDDDSLYHLSKEIMDPDTTFDRLIEISDDESDELDEYWEAYLDELIEQRAYIRLREIESQIITSGTSDSLIDEINDIHSECMGDGMADILANRLLNYFDN